MKLVRACVLVAGVAAGCGCAAKGQGASVDGGSPPVDAGADASSVAGRREALRAGHDAVRREVGVGPMQWDEALGRSAQAWADRLARRGCRLEHDSKTEYGENLFWSSAPSDAQEVVSSWASEKADYHHGRNRCSGVCGHYTQMVWKSSTRLGCGVASCGGPQIWVCRYAPAGNIVGQKPY